MEGKLKFLSFILPKILNNAAESHGMNVAPEINAQKWRKKKYSLKQNLVFVRTAKFMLVHLEKQKY